jgi:hypothetical protein
VTNIGGIQTPFTIGIQTSAQFELMLTWGHNETIWMDVTFGINDVKFHLFILMVFDSHWIGIPVAWIVISWQTWNDLIEWLAPLGIKLFSRMHGWKLVCFIVDDAPHELAALWWVPTHFLITFQIHLYHFYCYSWCMTYNHEILPIHVLLGYI